jgi:hypothetical protein
MATTLEVKETNWDLFCQRFEEAHRGTLVSMEVIYHDGTTESLAKDMPLRDFNFTKTEACSDLIRITLGDVSNRTVQHQVIEPVHVRLRDENGSRKILQIDAEAGSVELRFSSGRIGALMKEFELQ